MKKPTFMDWAEDAMRFFEDHGVDLGHFLKNALAVALGKATGDDYTAQSVVLFEPSNIENGIDRLTLGTFDKSAGVDDNYIRLRFVGGDLISCLEQLVEHDLRIKLILRAAERNKSDLHLNLR